VIAQTVSHEAETHVHRSKTLLKKSGDGLREEE